MAYRKSYRSKHRRSHRNRSHRKKRYSNNFMNSTVSAASSTNKKYMPKVKNGIENVGSKVIKTGSESVPFLQRMTRKFFGMFSRKKTKKHYKRYKH
jgi:hypothetical protein